MTMLMLDEKLVDVGTLQIEGIDKNDYPDFCDAYIAYGQFEDGTTLNDKQLDTLKQNYIEVFYELVEGTLN